eukprot:6483968-Pyramimonas_sp.AAC.1
MSQEVAKKLRTKDSPPAQSAGENKQSAARSIVERDRATDVNIKRAYHVETPEPGKICRCVFVIQELTWSPVARKAGRSGSC